MGGELFRRRISKSFRCGISNTSAIGLETNGAPVIVFAKGVDRFDETCRLKCDVLGVDWTKDLADVKRDINGRKALQGNLDPCVLFAPKEKIRQETERILSTFGGARAHFQPRPRYFTEHVARKCEISGGLREGDQHQISSTGSTMMSSKNELDISVLKKFNRPGPRYTSYPTAPVFTPDFTAEDFRREIVETNREPNAGPLSLYFHFPFCKKALLLLRLQHAGDERPRDDRGIQRLSQKEIDLLRPMISNDRKVSQLHWGGGTPSYLEPEQIIEVGGYVEEPLRLRRRYRSQRGDRPAEV